MSTLSPTQQSALAWVANGTGSDHEQMSLGILNRTLFALEGRGLIVWVDNAGHYSVTDAGRAAIAKATPQGAADHGR